MQKYSGFSTADDFEEVGGRGQAPPFLHSYSNYVIIISNFTVFDWKHENLLESFIILFDWTTYQGTVSLISSNPSCLIYNNTLETLKCGRHRRFSDLKSVNVSKIHNCFLKARIEFAQAIVFSHKSQRKKHSLKKQKHR